MNTLEAFLGSGCIFLEFKTIFRSSKTNNLCLNIVINIIIVVRPVFFILQTHEILTGSVLLHLVLTWPSTLETVTVTIFKRLQLWKWRQTTPDITFFCHLLSLSHSIVAFSLPPENLPFLYVWALGLWPHPLPPMSPTPSKSLQHFCHLFSLSLEKKKRKKCNC